jgi:hypothetical protein
MNKQQTSDEKDDEILLENAEWIESLLPNVCLLSKAGIGLED